VEKIDLKKVLRTLYDPHVGAFVTVEVPSMQFVQVDGRGVPNTALQYKSAVEWLYGVSYSACKRRSAGILWCRRWRGSGP
jgi:hypothetical protein